MTNKQFKDWLKNNNFSQVAFSKLIGESHTRINNYVTGVNKIPGWLRYITKTFDDKKGL